MDLMMHQRQLVNIPELSAEPGIAANFFYQRTRRNALPGPRRVGRYVRVDRAEFYAALERGEVR